MKIFRKFLPFAVKNMPQVTSTARTYYLDSRHPKRVVDVCGNTAFNAFVKRRPKEAIIQKPK